MDRVRRAYGAAVLLLAALACSSQGGNGAPAAGTCPEVAALEVVSTTPEHGQAGVSVQVAVAVRFNTCVDMRSVTPTSVSLRRGTLTSVPGEARWDGEQSALVFVPASPLAFDAEYFFSVMDVRGVRGESLAVPLLIGFRTRAAPETIPPTTAVTPPAGHYDAPQAVALACVDNVGGTGCVDTFYTVDGSAPTSSSARYVAPIVVEHSLTLRFFSVDGDGNAEVARSAQYVIDTVPPEVAATEPAAGAVGVRLDARVRVVFDEPMAASTLAAVPEVAPLAPGGITVEPGALAVIREPMERYECATTYEVTVPVTATDLAGNALLEPYRFTFTTSSDCDEPRTVASVASGAYVAAQEVSLSCDDGSAGSGCARIVYTLDGSVPTFSPENGVVVSGGSAGPIAIAEGETVLRFRAEDEAGNVEVIRERRYSTSSAGFSWLATGGGLARGVGQVPDAFVTVGSSGKTWHVARDAASGRLYRATQSGLVFSEDGVSFHPLPVRRPGSSASVAPTSVAAQGSRIYAGTWDGLFVSTDGGETFQARSFGGLYDANRITKVAVSGPDVYVATGTSLHVSHDRLRTWTSPFGAVADLAVDGDTVYVVAGAGGVAVSRDRGSTWAAPALPGNAGSAYAVAFQGDTVYVGCAGGVAVSTDRAATFTSLLPLDGNPVTRLGAGDGRVYASSKVLYSSAPSAFWVSTGGGFTRRHIPGGTRDADVYAIHVEGANVHVGAYPSYWTSRDHGATFALADLPGSDAHRVVAAGPKVYAAIHDSSGFGGLVVSSDRGTTFTYRGVEAGLPDGSIDDLFLDGGTLYAGTWRGLAITSDDGATFTVRTAANSGLWQSDASAVWASGSTVWAASTTKLQRSTDGGTSFADRVTGIYPGELAVSGSNVYLAVNDGVMVSNDGSAAGPTFTLRTTADGLADGYVRDLDVAPDGTLFVGTAGALDASKDGGATFQPVQIPASIFPYTVSACGGVLVAGSSDDVAISADGGATFAVRTSEHGVPGSIQDACYAGP